MTLNFDLLAVYILDMCHFAGTALPSGNAVSFDLTLNVLTCYKFELSMSFRSSVIHLQGSHRPVKIY